MFVWKDLLLFWRDRKGLVLLLLMPFLMILILGFAMKGLMEGSPEALRMKAALVVEDDEASGIERFRTELRRRSLPEAAESALAASAEQASPYTLLKRMMENEEVGKFVEFVPMDAETAHTALESGEVKAVLTVPPEFTYKALVGMLLGEDGGAALRLTAGESPVHVDVLQGMLNGFVRSLNFRTALGEYGRPDAEPALAAGGVESMTDAKPMNSFLYFTLAMSVMFVLFVAGTTAAKAFAELRGRVFDRVLLADRHPLRFLGGKAGAAFCVAWLQLTLLFVLSHLAFGLFPGRPFSFWLGLSAINAVLSIGVGGFAALLTALNFRFRSSTASSMFSSIAVTVMALAGGSFTPASLLPDWVMQIGVWTPNGLAISLYTLWIQGFAAVDMAPSLLKLAAFAVLTLTAGIYLFPARRRVA
ncbi:hypothetical protein PACILC2_50660 [Paenibacillus cisolokensis]|uniref:ABC-2 type transporter transmembrane domain-containing protein n=1 Tax=Paenibacillus cisolokensis TaxID=1658519 RepID=A0ABQ4NEU9_9BACL|nr:ABC transporter permease [Paenibacillus cisolokensis]GIQ66498.1 hypothetical protein PACILC2_50660 [Paenibacillus cisolokensis]